MQPLTSNYLSHKALQGLNKLGDIMLPGDNQFPRFSDTGCITHVDDVMEVTNPDDVAALNILLAVIHVMPAGFCVGLLKLTDKCSGLPDVIGSPMRMLNVALRGVPFSLYYSNLTAIDYRGKKVHDVMGYDVHCEPDYDFKNF